MTLRVIRSISDFEREKLRYLQPKIIGGQAGRTCTSFAPLSYKNSVVSPSCVPRTMESSINSRRLSRISSCTGISFIFAIIFRCICPVGIKDLGHVGVYLINGLANGTLETLEYPTACAIPESGTPATLSTSTSSRPASSSPQRFRIHSTLTPS